MAFLISSSFKFLIIRRMQHETSTRSSTSRDQDSMGQRRVRPSDFSMEEDEVA